MTRMLCRERARYAETAELGEFKVLREDKYEEALFHYFCANLHCVAVDLAQLKTQYGFVCAQLGIDPIDLNVMTTLFPNLDTLTLSAMTALSQSVLSDILAVFEKNET